MTRFDVARTQQPKSTAAYGSLRFGPLRYQLKRTIGMLPTRSGVGPCAGLGAGRQLSDVSSVIGGLATWPALSSYRPDHGGCDDRPTCHIESR
ncbi:hypothetical protein [Tateyamaria sp.]|uniref:hypothetical protein n=1 Tax=Tateyamaria sp. TaxID=1929288 RepID=UPI003B212E7E